MPFSPLGLSAQLCKALAARNYNEPTPIQSQAIGPILAGKDILALAPTGSGKTAAFVLPLLERYLSSPTTVDRARRVSVLILVPTRELCMQVGELVNAFTAGMRDAPKLAVLFGGVSINPQMLYLRGGADFVVATPGRLLDLVSKNAVNLNHVETLVLDEADRLLALGFEQEINSILNLLPKQRQNLFFSATFARDVEHLALHMLQDPVRISLDGLVTTAPDIFQRAIRVDADRRTQLLIGLFKNERWKRVLVFVASKYACEHVAQKLRRAGLPAAAFHGGASQGARVDALDQFKESQVRIIVATDLAARGLDITDLPVVLNYDLPRSADDYVHRIGRTGRAGASGMAISFITAENEAHFRLIEKRQDQFVERETVAGFEPRQVVEVGESDVGALAVGLDPNGGVKGTRKSKKDKLREAAARLQRNVKL